MSKPSISILGCGWLGFPLAQSLVSEGFKVNGSTQTESKLTQLTEAGIHAFHLRLSPHEIQGDIAHFLQSDILILNIPPGRRNPNVSTDFPQTIPCRCIG